MKIELNNIVPKFQPVELKITIENPEELKVIMALFQSNDSATAAAAEVGSLDPDEQRLLSRMMGDIFYSFPF